MDSHYLALVPTYIFVTSLWFLLNHYFKSLWSRLDGVCFKRPWLEFIYSILAVIAILGIGQLYMRGLLIPNRDNIFVDALNQFLIFSPGIVLLVVRKQSAATVWLPGSLIFLRIAIGLALAVFSIFIYWIFREDAASFGSILANTWHLQNISHLVQVFMEDLTIALVFVRLSSWIGRKNTIAAVALLFAAGHVPALLSEGFAVSEMGSLLIDAFIGLIVLTAVSKSKDIWWFFLVHFALDMSQYYGGL